MLEPLVWGFDIEKVVGNSFNIVLIMIIFDIITGLLVAGIERKINSSVNYQGLIRKAGLLVGLTFITVVDVYFHMEGTLVKIGVGLMIAYEGISIIENFSRIGVNLNFLTKYFDPDKVEGVKENE